MTDPRSEVERLRAEKKVMLFPALKRQKERIASLQAENERLTKQRDEWKEMRDEMAREAIRLGTEVGSLEARLNEAEQALQYIERPTMGLPGGADAEAFVDEASEANVRLALKTCIRTARTARASIIDPEGGDKDD